MSEREKGEALPARVCLFIILCVFAWVCVFGGGTCGGQRSIPGIFLKWFPALLFKIQLYLLILLVCTVCMCMGLYTHAGMYMNLGTMVSYIVCMEARECI